MRQLKIFLVALTAAPCLSAMANPPTIRPLQVSSTNVQKVEILNLDDVKNFPLTAAGEPKVFFWTENQFVSNYALEIRSRLYSPTLSLGEQEMNPLI